MWRAVVPVFWGPITRKLGRRLQLFFSDLEGTIVKVLPFSTERASRTIRLETSESIHLRYGQYQRCGTVTVVLKFWFQLLKSYGSGSSSYFLKDLVPVPAPYLDHKKQIFQKNVGIFFAFLHIKRFYKEIFFYKFQQIYCKM